MPRSSGNSKRLRPCVRGLRRLRARARPGAWDIARRELLDDYKASYEALRSDPEAWRAELEERAGRDPMLVPPPDWDDRQRVIDVARDTAGTVFADRLRDFEAEYTGIYDTDIECLCITVGIAADEDEFLTLRRTYHRALKSVLGPEDWSQILVCVESS